MSSRSRRRTATPLSYHARLLLVIIPVASGTVLAADRDDWREAIGNAGIGQYENRSADYVACARATNGAVAQVTRQCGGAGVVAELDATNTDEAEFGKCDCWIAQVSTVEREGISVQHPSRFVLIGSMNPEEGDLRPQLLDRFAHAVDVTGIEDAAERVAILQRRLEYDLDPDGFVSEWKERETSLGEQVIAARRCYHEVEYTDRDLYTIAALTTNFGVDGHRADIVILKTACAQAAFEGRRQITTRDIHYAAELALPHRMKKQPFMEAGLHPDHLQKNLEEAEAQAQQMVDSDEQATEDVEGTQSADEKKVKRTMTRA